MLQFAVNLGFYVQLQVNSEAPESKSAVSTLKELYPADPTTKLRLFMSGGIFLFYMGAIWVAFTGYREFKGIMEDQGYGEQIRANNLMSQGTLQQRQSQGIQGRYFRLS